MIMHICRAAILTVLFAYSTPLWGADVDVAPMSEIMVEEAEGAGKVKKVVTAVEIDNSVEKEAVFNIQGEAGNDSEKDGEKILENDSLWVVLLRFAGSFLLLLGLVWIVIVILKRILPAKNQIFSTKSVEVLSRTHLDSRRYIALIRIGTRVLVVGVGPESISVLSEITDPEEVAAVLAETRPVNESGKNIFRKLLKGNLLRGNDEIVNLSVAERDADVGENPAQLNGGKNSIHARLSDLRNNDQ